MNESTKLTFFFDADHSSLVGCVEPEKGCAIVCSTLQMMAQNLHVFVARLILFVLHGVCPNMIYLRVTSTSRYVS